MLPRGSLLRSVEGLERRVPAHEQAPPLHYRTRPVAAALLKEATPPRPGSPSHRSREAPVCVGRLRKGCTGAFQPRGTLWGERAAPDLGPRPAPGGPPAASSGCAVPPGRLGAGLGGGPRGASHRLAAAPRRRARGSVPRYPAGAPTPPPAGRWPGAAMPTQFSSPPTHSPFDASYRGASRRPRWFRPARGQRVGSAPRARRGTARGSPGSCRTREASTKRDLPQLAPSAIRAPVC